MGHSTLLISLSLITLLCGLSIAAYQLWSAETARQDKQQSALAARYGGKTPSAAPRPEPIPMPIRDEPRVAPATPRAEADVIAAPPPQADRLQADGLQAESPEAGRPDVEGSDVERPEAERSEAENPKRGPRAPRRKPKPDLTHNA